MNKEPIYPKPNPEYTKKVMERFYKQVKETNWNCDNERISKVRGRKPKQTVRLESRPRTEGERIAASKQTLIKQSKYNWL